MTETHNKFLFCFVFTGFKVCALTMGKGEGERTLNWSSGSLLLLTLGCYVSLG